MTLMHLDRKTAEAEFFRCCGSSRFASELAAGHPYADFEGLVRAADRVWFSLSKTEWLEAFSHHPRIGGDIAALRKKFQPTTNIGDRPGRSPDWSSQEQAGVQGASEDVLNRLSKGNEDYEKRFGHVFLICATGKSAEEMLKALENRIGNSPEEELKNACIEQSKITRIRLEKLAGS